VEFALLLPILFVVLLAVVQVGVIARDGLLLSQAARAGARAAAVTLDEAAVVDATVQAAPGLAADAIGVDITRAAEVGGPVTVSVSYEATVAGPLAGWLLPATVHLDASATMRQEVG
jgi:Flp pilus assembly protein TadG